MPDTRINQRKWLIVAGLCLFTVAAYWQVTDCAFVTYDDGTYVTGNAHVRNGLSWSNLVWALTATQAANWHPLTWVSHILDCQLFGLNPAGHHVTNLIIHIANVVLLFSALRFVTATLWRSALVAALFAVHPLNVESVAWIAERKNVLSTMFWILTIWAYAWYAKKPAWQRYLLVVAGFAFGLMSKPMLVTLPFVLLLLDYWPLRRISSPLMPSAPERTTDSDKPRKRPAKGKVDKLAPGFAARPLSALILEKVPLLLLAIATSVITIVAQRQGKAIGTLESYPIAVRLENALVSYAAYLVQTFWPSRLCVFYPHPKTLLAGWLVGVATVGLLAVTAASLGTIRRFPFLTVGWLWYLGTMVPVIGLVQVGLQSRADRYTYVPMIGIFIIIAWMLNELAKRLPSARTTIAGAAVLVLLVLALISHIQVGYWHDSTALFTRAVNVTGNNYIAQNNLGEALGLQGKYDEAERHFAAAVSINPDYSLALNNLAMSRVQSGSLDEAIELFSRAVENDPTFSEAYNRLAAALLQKNRTDEAFENLQKALALNPNFSSAYANLGALYEKQNKTDEALNAYAKALEASQINSFSAQMNYKLGVLLEKKGDNQQALTRYREAIRLKPDFSQAQQNVDLLLDKMKTK